MKYDKEVIEEVRKAILGMMHYKSDPDNPIKLIPKDERSIQLLQLANSLSDDSYWMKLENTRDWFRTKLRV